MEEREEPPGEMKAPITRPAIDKNRTGLNFTGKSEDTAVVSITRYYIVTW